MTKKITAVFAFCFLFMIIMVFAFKAHQEKKLKEQAEKPAEQIEAVPAGSGQ